MRDLIGNVCMWGENAGMYDPTSGITAYAQIMKSVAEAGELFDNILKQQPIKDDIGDIFVTVILAARMAGADPVVMLSSAAEDRAAAQQFMTDIEGNDTMLHAALYALHKTQTDALYDFNPVNGLYNTSLLVTMVSILTDIAAINGLTIRECLEHSYDEIKDRVLIAYNGVLIKSTDPAYTAACEKARRAKDRAAINLMSKTSGSFAHDNPDIGGTHDS